ncbi:hypothetical protein LCGC14_2479520 [marine sediment metagenome]|uniref:Uncharacterized protein n=1 Tax=marine sediment metagenome TaxID=412755 RepID=A0A0F9B8Q8_9ZZZZ
MKHCGHADHVNPYWNCRHCFVQASAYTFQLKGTGWTPRFNITTDDLPRHDEVIARKREQGLQTLRTSDQDS